MSEEDFDSPRWDTQLKTHFSSPIHDAAAKGNLTALQALLSEGNINLADEINNTALHYASGAGHEVVVQWLLQQNADLNLANLMGDCPLHRAVWRSHAPIVKILLESGADITIKNTMGRVPIELARDPEVEALLQSFRVIHEAEAWMVANSNIPWDGDDYSNNSEEPSSDELPQIVDNGEG